MSKINPNDPVMPILGAPVKVAKDSELYIVTVEKTDQVGETEFRRKLLTKIFKGSDTTKEIFDWVRRIQGDIETITIHENSI